MEVVCAIANRSFKLYLRKYYFRELPVRLSLLPSHLIRLYRYMYRPDRQDRHTDLTDRQATQTDKTDKKTREADKPDRQTDIQNIQTNQTDQQSTSSSSFTSSITCDKAV